MDRVSEISGKIPVLVVAPHGYSGDDMNTALVAESIAHSIKAYAVINRGWERADSVDYLKDKADCNNVLHCHEDVVREEFLEPIIRFKNRILKSFDECFVYYIHGMSDRHRQLSGDPFLDMVIGYGAGAPNSFSCEPWRKDLMIHTLKTCGLHAFEGKKGGTMSGWARNNMNQLFRKWYPEIEVQSMQLEIVHSLREEDDLAILTGEFIASVISDMLDITNFSSNVANKSY